MWLTIKLDDVIEEIRERTKEFNEVDLPYIGLEHIEPNSLTINSVGNIKDVISDKTYFKPNDILFGTLRPYFRKVYHPKFEGLCSTEIAVLRTKEDSNSRFFFYFIANKTFIDHASAISNGSRMPRAKWSILKEDYYKIPDIETQKKIASILSAYDDLIENNLQRIKLLEEAAQHIYKEWFVHFRFPGYEKAEFENGLPKGWEKIAMGDCYSLFIGGGWGSDKLENDYTQKGYVIRGTDFNSINSGNISLPLRYHKDSNIKSRNLEPGDIILEVSNGNLHKVGSVMLVSEKLLITLKKKAICASFCKMLRPKKRELQNFIYLYINEMNQSGRMNQYKSPSAAGINNFHSENFLNKEKVLLPSTPVLIEFTNIINSIIDQKNNLILQIVTLKEGRDILLPRLMNQTIEV